MIKEEVQKKKEKCRSVFSSLCLHQVSKASLIAESLNAWQKARIKRERERALIRANNEINPIPQYKIHGERCYAYVPYRKGIGVREGLSE